MKKKYLVFLIFIFLSFIPLLDLFHPGLPVTHDGQDHVTRIANFYQNLQEGNIVPRWAGNLNWGYGHPILMFLYPLPSYLASFFHFVGFSLVDSLKIVFGLGFIASGFSMYLWIKEFLGEEAGVVSAALYLFAPYRFVDLYVRGAIGEHVAFIFPPLICYFLLKVSKKYSYWYVVGGSFSLAGLILSHNAITIMFLPLIFLYSSYLLYYSKNKSFLISHFSFLIFLGFGLASFFLLPAFFEGKYTLRDIVTKGEYITRFVEWKDFLYGQWSYGGSGLFTVQVGIMQWILVILAVFASFKKRVQYKSFLIGSIVLFLLTLFIMTSSSKIIWETITLLQKFQFPWRFLSVTVFLTSFMGGIVTVVFFTKKIRKVLICGILVGVLLISRNYWHANGYLNKQETFFTGIYNGTTDTGESAPIWSVRFMEQPPKSRVEVIGGSAIVVENKRTSTRHEYTIDAISNAQIRENTLYFPGWEVLVDNKKVSVEFQSQVNRGVMTFFLEKGKHSVIVKFTDTKLRFLANIISVISLATLLFWGILNKRKLWPHFR